MEDREDKGIGSVTGGKAFFSSTECTFFLAFERSPLLCDVGKSNRIQKISQMKGKEVEHFVICQEKCQENQD